MSQTERLSLSWDSHQKSICNGLSVLQQRGEYVDMTLAADGHYVKVHQMVVSLVSPYLKDLISTAPCPHPVIFLNNISYTTLCAILEYVYTGEVQVPRDKLPDLLSAGRALHIRGLKDMNEGKPPEESRPTMPSLSEILKEEQNKDTQEQILTSSPEPICKIYISENANNYDTTMDTENESSTDIMAITDTSIPLKKNKKYKKDDKPPISPETTRNVLLSKQVQYSISNQGGLQAVYNRYIYNLRYISKTNGRRFWRCVQYSSNNNCPANISTLNNNTVVDRTFTHNHPFEDKKILKKFSSGIIFTYFKEAETQSAVIKKKDLKMSNFENLCENTEKNPQGKTKV
ncbi:unnamed protein product [Spodoptera littoralis]|uniref:BTB domain-containing protein n=1 Tax=Spodoptera littoralis TaxID=7109 RepID=A0A9P0IHH7_SPOLI|nr:unnamed protein product [Spodoptera littoralis]CAH1646834.1 unnamed protein product [Spodoptera littoralis]